MRLSLRSRLTANPFLGRRDHGITVLDATLRRHLMFHVERPHTAAREGHVHDLLKRALFDVLRVHIHSLCENFHGVK